VSQLSCRAICQIARLRFYFHWAIWQIALLLAACAAPPSPVSPPVDFAAVFPDAGAVPGWSVFQERTSYNRDNLYNLVDGQAESFFAYGFQEVAVQRYEKGEARLNLEIWRLAAPADAFGLFSAGRAGDPAEIGVEGDTDPGRRLAFWQDLFFASLTASREIPEEELWAFARAVSASLPQGGERPALLGRLPQTGKVERSELFFHEEMSIQMEIWLGGENLLGLSQETVGVLARYNLAGQTVRLVLIEYPSAGEAGKGLEALQSAGMEGLLASDTHGNLLGAAFGEAGADRAEALLQEALKKE
jgi:hypothetical protein